MKSAKPVVRSVIVRRKPSTHQLRPAKAASRPTTTSAPLGWAHVVSIVISASIHGHAAGQDLSSVPPDLIVPACLVGGKVAAGQRVTQTTAGWQDTDVHHSLYLPVDWKPGARLPVLVEYPGNGNFRDAFGDVSTGRVEDGHLGYGISGGAGFIWVVMPFVEASGGRKQNAITWWGDVEESKRYCIATVRDVCARFGGDDKKVVLCGFSRGAIACNYIGLHDDQIASLWRAFICHSHYDGVKEKWPYPEAGRSSALVRLRRLNGRPQFISHEMSTTPTADYLRGTGISGRWTFEPVPFRNHSDEWTLRDIPSREKLRDWLSGVLTQ